MAGRDRAKSPGQADEGRDREGQSPAYPAVGARIGRKGRGNQVIVSAERLRNWSEQPQEGYNSGLCFISRPHLLRQGPSFLWPENSPG